jgi:hypothetical protein
LHMQLKICWNMSLTCRFSADCLWCVDNPLGAGLVICSSLPQFLAGSGWLAWASLLVVAGLCVHIKLIQLWVLVTLQFSFGCPFLGLLWRLLPLCSLCWCSGSHQFGWGSLPNCLGYWCRVLCRNSASMLVRLKDIEGSFMLQLTSMC